MELQSSSLRSIRRSLGFPGADLLTRSAWPLQQLLQNAPRTRAGPGHSPPLLKLLSMAEILDSDDDSVLLEEEKVVARDVFY